MGLGACNLQHKGRRMWFSKKWFYRYGFLGRVEAERGLSTYTHTYYKNISD